MRTAWALLILGALLAVMEMLPVVKAGPYIDEDEALEPDDYSENAIEQLLQNAQKRASRIYVNRRTCVERGGNCDHRPNDCCNRAPCKCNLWGSNCKCQRVGLFQKWG